MALIQDSGMAVELARPDHIVVRTPSTTLSTGPRAQQFVRAAIEAIVRSLLIGVGVGVTISVGHSASVVGIATVGILAIGAALASWGS
jgi:hypothetical protein